MARKRDGGERMVMLPHRRKAFRGFNPAAYGTVRLRFSLPQQVGFSNGDQIATLTDSVNGWTFTQTTAGARPIFTTNVIGSRPAASFNGTTQYMLAASSAMLDVLKNVASATAMTVLVPTRSGGSPSSNPAFAYRRNVASSSRLVLASNNAGQFFQAVARPNDAVTGGTANEGSNFTVSTPYVMTIQALFSAGTVDVYRDATVSGSASFTATNTSNTASAEIGLGSGTSGTPGFYTGYIADHILWVPALSPTELLRAINDLRKDYGL